MTGNPEWLTTPHREADARSGLVVYGNTEDLFWSGVGTEYLTIPQQQLRRLDQFILHATWNRVDGLRFCNDPHTQRWHEAVEWRLSPDTDRGQAHNLGDDEPRFDTAHWLALDEPLARYRLAIGQGIRPPLIIEIFDWTGPLRCFTDCSVQAECGERAALKCALDLPGVRRGGL